MLKTRFLTALLALPVLILVIVIGGWLFAGFLTLVLIIGGWEYVNLLRKTDYHPPQWLVWALVLLPLAVVWFEHEDWRAPGMILLLIAGMVYASRRLEAHDPQPITDFALAVFGGVYVGWLGSTLLAVRQMDDGAFLTVFIYGMVAWTDTAAYFVGRLIGKHKMAPAVSPKKSWEGYIASVIGGLLVGVLVGVLTDQGGLTVGHGAAIGLLIGSLGTAGDLGISVIKRQVGAKDSSKLIPGHGGILDRIDSVLVAAAVSYYYLIWFVS